MEDRIRPQGKVPPIDISGAVPPSPQNYPPQAPPQGYPPQGYPQGYPVGPQNWEPPKKGGVNMGAIAAAVLAIVASVGIMMALAPWNGMVDQVNTQLAPIVEKINTLDAQVQADSGRIEALITADQNFVKTSALGTYASEGDVQAVSDELTALKGGLDNASSPDSLVSLRARVAALEAQLADDGGGGTGGTTEVIKWKFETPALLTPVSQTPIVGSGGVLTTWVDWDGTIKEDDLYYVDLYIANNHAADTTTLIPPSFFVRLKLKPYSTSDYALLDDEETYLDTDDSPTMTLGVSPSMVVEPSWDASFEVKPREGRDVTKYVLFESSNITVNTIPSQGYVKIPLVLELHYAE